MDKLHISQTVYTKCTSSLSSDLTSVAIDCMSKRTEHTQTSHAIKYTCTYNDERLSLLTISLGKNLALRRTRVSGWNVDKTSFLLSEVVKKENLSSFHVHRSNWEISTITILNLFTIEQKINDHKCGTSKWELPPPPLRSASLHGTFRHCTCTQ